MSYDLLRVIWWLLLGTLLSGFAIMDGFDLGTAALLPFVARSDIERRVVLNTVGPVWEGNQVWLIVGAGVIFAAWPALYAASFSGFYLAMFLVLATLILRPVGFKYRSKIDSPVWREFWDWVLFAGGVVPSLVFGVAFGNLFEGVPFAFDVDLRFQPDITLFSLLNPFALLVGLVSLAMIALHGAAWLAAKTEDPISSRARMTVPFAAIGFVILFGVAGLWLAHMPGYAIVGAIAANAPSNPMFKTVSHEGASWFANYAAHPALWLLPILAVGAALLSAALRRWPTVAFLWSCVVPGAVIATAGAALFPFLLPSSTNPGASLTVWDASSSKLTLYVMLGAVVLMLPVIMAYTSWVYYVMRGPVTEKQVNSDHTSY